MTQHLTSDHDNEQICQTLGDCVDRCLRHALVVLDRSPDGLDLREDDCDVVVFKQVWSNTACGWPGVAGQAITSAYTVVVLGLCDDAVVYFGRPAYRLARDANKHDRARFFDALGRRNMPRVNECSSIGCVRI